MQKYIAEFIGTFTLVFCGTGAIIIDDISNGTVTHVGIAITFGLVVMAMIYTYGETSGAHLNPAVTIAFWLAKKLPGKEVAPYVIAQILAGLAASATLAMLFPTHNTLGATQPSDTVMQTFVMELLLTFFLMTVIINVSTGSKETGVMAGIAIGGTVLLEALFAGPITGASMNPARSIGPAIVSMELSHLWIYIVAPTLGAAIAIWVCKWTKGPECCTT